MRLVFVTILLLSFPALAAARCKSDKDCKGDRICAQGECVNPSVTTEPAPVSPASGCAIDNDCKGDRICVRSECVEPSVMPASGSSARSAGVPGPQPDSPQAGSQETNAPASGVRKHDGFFMQIQAGAAYLEGGFTLGSDYVLYGPGVGLSLALGGTPRENFVIFGEVMTQIASSPTFERNGNEQNVGDSVSLSFTSVGPGVAFYSGESGFFLGGSVGFAAAQAEAGSESETLRGFGIRAGGGKEWWVDDQWGVGLAANLFYASLSLEDASYVYAWSFALNLTATYH